MQSSDADGGRGTRRPGRVVDRTATVVLLVVMAVVAAALFFFGALIGMQADVCAGEATCDYPQIDVATLAAVYAPAALLLLAVVLTVLRWRRGRLTVPVPLIGIAAIVLVVLGSDAVISTAIVPR